jgi:uncharacterized repeat protein (TIGR01451 family)
MRKMLPKTLLAVVAAGVTMPALAAEKLPAIALLNEQQQDKVVEENGLKRHVLVTPAKVVPGDHMVYSLSYKSNLSVPLTNVELTDPVPTGTALEDDGTGAYDVSVDGGKTWGKLSALTVSDGKGASRAAQASDVTNLRWVIAQIAPGGGGKVSFRAVVK